MEEWGEDCADDESEEGKDEQREVADEDSELVGKETKVRFCGCVGLA